MSSSMALRTSFGVRTLWSRLQAGVPDRVPDGIGERLDPAPAVVDQEQVEVAAGRQLAAPVSADGQQGHALVVAAGGPGEHLLQPGVGGLGVAPAPVDAGQTSDRRAAAGPGGPQRTAGAAGPASLAAVTGAA